jgi:flagellar motor protein MotB
LSDSDSGLHSSLTDLAMSLMVIFILLLVNFLRAEQKRDTSESTIRDRVSELREELESIRKILDAKELRGITIKVDENDPLTLVVIVPESAEGGDLFKSNSSVIQPYLHVFLETFGPPFFSLVAKPEWADAIRSIIIEGHTDDVPVANEEYGNLRLSQERSKEVLQAFLQMAKAQDGRARDAFWSLASASGRADKDCRVSAHPTVEERRKCRSVQFKIRMKSSMEKKFEREVAKKGNHGGDS